jgi:uncharacterized membrane protein
MKFPGEILQGKLFGHPIHMMLIHFPSALLPLSVIFDAAGIYFKESNFILFSFYSAAAGAAAGWFALIFGIIDLLKIESSSKAFSTGLWHGGLNLLWLLIFSLFTGIDLKSYPGIDFPSSGEFLSKIIAAAGPLYSNFLGAELVLKYGIGRKKI